jgi:hypothetical protein
MAAPGNTDLENAPPEEQRYVAGLLRATLKLKPSDHKPAI